MDLRSKTYAKIPSKSIIIIIDSLPKIILKFIFIFVIKNDNFDKQCISRMEVKIGERIKSIFEARQMKLKDFAEEVGVARQNVYRIFEKDSIDTDLLIKISSVLDHNFFQHYDNQSLNLPVEPNVNGDTELQGVQKELEHYKNELRLAKKEIDYLKKIIELMEERTKLLLTQK